ncbi:MAG: tetratricopeptide repeat protein, partial [Proteobacteria bacterium]|nr:tetratricopeptide repeat protein [Pseudomonadota bacterium]
MSSPYLKQVLHLRELSNREPENHEHHYNLGVALIHAEDYKAAIESFKQTLLLDKSNAMAHYNLGI